METQKNTEKAFPLSVLVRNADGTFARFRQPVEKGTNLGICVEKRAWMLVKLPTCRCSPEVFLQTVANLTGLPLCYPEHADFLELQKAAEAVKETFGQLRQAEKAKHNSAISKMNRFSGEEEQCVQNYLSQKRDCSIRLVIDLEKLF